MSNQEIEYWNVGESEQLSHKTQDEAIECYLDGFDGDMPATVEVIGYARMKPEVSFLASHLLSQALESLDDEFGDPDGDYTEPTKDMRSAEQVFIKAILAQYTSWLLKEARTVTVDVPLWIRRQNDLRDAVDVPLQTSTTITHRESMLSHKEKRKLWIRETKRISKGWSDRAAVSTTFAAAALDMNNAQFNYATKRDGISPQERSGPGMPSMWRWGDVKNLKARLPVTKETK